jgi:uncharacterized membrane protein
MESAVLDWLNLLARWTHVLAAILWIGDSFLFMWMDGALVAPSRPREGAVVGELWLVHSGGFYEVVKRKFLAPSEMPASLHWFKWEAYTTWLSGFFLLGVVYYLGGGVYLIDRSVANLGVGAAIALSLAVLAGGWLLYDALWSSSLRERPRVAGALSFALLVAAAYGLTHVFSGRAAFLHFGALLGTIMAANVWRRIIPAQTQMLAATRAGTPVDVSLGLRAKRRSIHNHYLTLPVLFTMLSNHFPGLYGHRLNWLVLVLLCLFGAAFKYFMNVRARGNRLVLAAGALALIAVVALTTRPAPTRGAAAAGAGEHVSFGTVQAILERRCVTCHSAHPSNPSFPAPPNGIILEDPRRIQSLAPRILERAVVTRTMPLGNLTGITDEERAQLGAWIAEGARIDDTSPASPSSPR